MNDNQVLEQLSETDPYAPGTLMPASAWSREAALSEIERRMGMEPHESTKRPAITSTPTRTEQPTMARTPVGKEPRAPWWRGPRVVVSAFAVTAMVVVAVLVLTNLTDSDGTDAASGPSATINDYVDAYNDGNIDEIMALFTEQSVITGHPFNFGGVTGIGAIRGLQEMDLRAAATENAYTISNVAVSGNTVTWDHVWIGRDGDQFCKQGHSAVVMDSKILSWDWGAGKVCG